MIVINPLTPLLYVFSLCFISSPLGELSFLIMKATVFLTYGDESEISFEFQSDESWNAALAVLMIVCRGALMASLAHKVTAYDQEGFDICSYVK